MRNKMIVIVSFALAMIILAAVSGACCEGCLKAVDKAPVEPSQDYGKINPIVRGAESPIYCADLGAQEIIKCSKCDGSGKCWVCSGKGKNDSGNECSICSGSGKCYYCNGTGKSE